MNTKNAIYYEITIRLTAMRREEALALATCLEEQGWCEHANEILETVDAGPTIDEDGRRRR